jgi:hypothetical protein
MQVELVIIPHYAASVGGCILENAGWVLDLVFDVAKLATSLETVPKQLLLGVKGLKQATISQGNPLKQGCTHLHQTMSKLM